VHYAESLMNRNGMDKESKKERWARYTAQIIAEKHGVPMERAKTIAAAVLETEQRAINQARKNVGKLRAAKFNRKRKAKTQYKVFGPPLQGGLPGLGKRR
jgi:hypothetical protein